MDSSGNPLLQNNEVALHNFSNHPNFGKFIDLIRGNEDPAFDCRLLDEYCVDNQFGSTTLGDMRDFDGVSNPMMTDLSFVLNSSFSSLNAEVKGGDLGEDDHDEDDSSGPCTTMTTKRSKVDQSRTLISERKRRGRMKKKLYQLRALVPNITKMDKASIVGDAVLYVQELQTKANKLKAEIADLEASLAGSGRHQESLERPRKTQLRSSNLPICKKIIQMDAFQVEERGFYLRLVCNKGQGVAISLYRALESLTSFIVQNSNLATVSERLELTFTLHVREGEPSMHLPNLRLWVISALMNQGFEFQTRISV